MSNILIIDIETAPKLAYVWQFWKANIGAKQVLDHGYIMSYAAKWLGSKDVLYEESRKVNDAEIVDSINQLLDQADIVVAHNAKRFDLPTIAARSIVNGLRPPSPYRVVDTLLEARKEFKFESYSLEYLSKVLGCTPKSSHKKFPGFELWLECMRNNAEAWEELKEYNIQDVETLEEVYLKMRPWVKSHPNLGVYKERSEHVCPKCGSHHVQLRGFCHTNVGKYQRFQCNDCGGWGRSRYTQYPKDKVAGLIVNVG